VAAVEAIGRRDVVSERAASTAIPSIASVPTVTATAPAVRWRLQLRRWLEQFGLEPGLQRFGLEQFGLEQFGFRREWFWRGFDFEWLKF